MASLMQLKQQDRIKALYVAYVTEQLKLTPDEAQKVLAGAYPV